MSNIIEISKRALISNLKTLEKRTAGALVCPIIKANAYGHGFKEIGGILYKKGRRLFGVTSLFEAFHLRRICRWSRIVIVGPVMLDELESAIKAGFDITVSTLPTLRRIARLAHRTKKRTAIHIKIETGSNRQGFLLDEIPAAIRIMRANPSLHMAGISTHFANIEEAASEFAGKQLARLHAAVMRFSRSDIAPDFIHAANSAATLLLPQTHFSLVRPGIALYGLWPSQKVRAAAQKLPPRITLHPVLSWRTHIAQIKSVAKGEFIGYGCSYRTERNSRIAVVPTGYYEGYDRALSNKGEVLVHGRRCRVRGRICMNMMMIDVTAVPRAHCGDRVTLIGKDGSDEITADELADKIGTINYEVVSRINPDLPRIIV